MIRVVIVDDSLTVRHRLAELLREAGGFEVVGEAADGMRALELARTLRPDVITLDLVLPDLDGLAATEQIMAHAPTPILIVSAAQNRGAALRTYDALAAGAVDVLDKPGAGESTADWDARFVSAVRMVSKIKVITHPRGRLAPTRGRIASAAMPALVPARCEVVALGASTGGPSALVAVLSGMPRLAIPTLAMLHIDAPFAASFAHWLGDQTGRQVQLATDRESLEPGKPGRVLFAPPGKHLVVEGRRARLVDGPQRNFCLPSIDVLFESIAVHYGPAGVACLLTGMGRDGAAGLLAIRRAGGGTFAQDESTSVVYGMPREAVECGAVDRGLPLHELGPAIGAFVNGGVR